MGIRQSNLLISKTEPATYRFSKLEVGLALLAAALVAALSVCVAPAHAQVDTVRIGFFASEKYGYVGA